MKNINELINQISFDQADDQIELVEIHQDIYGRDHHIFSFGIKKLFVFLISLIVPCYILITSINHGISHIPAGRLYLDIILNIIFLFLLVIILYSFFFINQRLKLQYLNRYRFQLVIYIIIQSTVIGYGSIYALWMFSTKAWFFVIGTMIFYLGITITCVGILTRTALKETLNEKYGYNLPITKFSKGLQYLIAGAIGLGIMSVYGYRTFKAFFIINQTTPNQIIGGLSHVVILIGIMILVLMPTLFFDAELVIRGKLLMKYSEKFRLQYNYSKDDWYGEDKY